MNVVFRVDASIEMGTGHVMRCLTLADELKTQGATVTFVTRALEGHLTDTITAKGFPAILLKPPTDGIQQHNDDVPHALWLQTTQEQDAKETIAALSGLIPDWLIVDHYALDVRWHKALRDYTKKIFVIDDLADRILDCDLLLDQTFGRSAVEYKPVTRDQCVYLLGSEFALIRSEFSYLRPKAIEKRKTISSIKKVLVAMGGIDQDNTSEMILHALSKTTLTPLPSVTVILSNKAPHIKAVQQAANSLPIKIAVLVDSKDMAKHMLEADLAIGASGTTTWERCCLGLPSLMLVLAKNQERIALELEKQQAAFRIGYNQPRTFNTIQQKLIQLYQDNNLLKKMAEAAFNIADGNGTCRVIRTMRAML